MTANSQFTSDLASKGLGAAPTVVYSGVEPDFFFSGTDSPETPVRFSLNVIGSVYFPDKLGSFFEGVRAWFDSLSAEQRQQVTITYLGGDAEIVRSVAASHWPQMPLQAPGYVPVAEMARFCKAAAANAYIANPTTFHHKLLELLACGRPVIAFPSEMAESVQLANSLGAGLLIADTTEAVTSLVKHLHTSWQSGAFPAPRRDVARHLSWAAQTDILERVLVRVVGSH